MPEIYSELFKIKVQLEKHYSDMQDIEFTIQEGKLWMLQTRVGKRTGSAAIKMAVDMKEEGMISKEVALKRVNPEQIDELLHPRLDKKMRKMLCFWLKAYQLDQVEHQEEWFLPLMMLNHGIKMVKRLS